MWLFAHIPLFFLYDTYSTVMACKWMNGTMWWLIGVFFAAQWNDSDCVYGMPDCYCFKTCRISAYAATSKFDISFVICVHMEQTAGVLVTFCYCKKNEWMSWQILWYGRNCYLHFVNCKKKWMSCFYFPAVLIWFVNTKLCVWVNFFPSGLGAGIFWVKIIRLCRC
jgi:hypothetical protein